MAPFLNPQKKKTYIHNVAGQMQRLYKMYTLVRMDNSVRCRQGRKGILQNSGRKSTRTNSIKDRHACRIHRAKPFLYDSKVVSASPAPII